jgi:hypothetical protein
MKDDLKASRMMAHLREALERGEDIGHYGRLTFAMVGRHFMDHDELCALLSRCAGSSAEEVEVMVRQVESKGYNPPRRERILEWQKEQEFPICPNPEDPDGCNVYRDLKFPDRTYKNIEHYQEEKLDAQIKS